MIKHVSPGELMSLATVHNGTAILSGQVALDQPHGDLQTQAREIFSRIDAILVDVGSGRNRLLSATIWLTDLTDFPAFNALWLEWLGDAPKPARATVQAGLALPGLKLEIQVTAAADVQP